MPHPPFTKPEIHTSALEDTIDSELLGLVRLPDKELIVNLRPLEPRVPQDEFPKLREKYLMVGWKDVVRMSDKKLKFVR
jgi:hypothetical protein